MWARHFEISLGLWLCLGPFVFAHGADERALWITDLSCGTALILLACLSYARSLRRAHLLELVAVGWLVMHGWLLATETGSPAGQNQLVVGMLVAMFAIIPSRASCPPDAWQDAWRQRGIDRSRATDQRERADAATAVTAIRPLGSDRDQ